MKFLICFLLVLSFFVMPKYTLAQGHSMYCDQVDSTAATQNCLKRHLDSAQRRLNKIYGELQAGLQSDKQSELKELQQTWLDYRDAECMWEAARSDTVPLNRLNELSCMARLTEDRADILAIVLDSADQSTMAREYGSFPRWMNVVAKDNPDVFWDYRTRTGEDLDCDGEEEYIIKGIRTSSKKHEKDEQDSVEDLIFTKELVLAIVQNPAIGRPVAEDFSFQVVRTEADNTICSDEVVLNFTPAPKAEEEQDPKVEAPACAAQLEITAKGCPPKIISWTGKNFALAVEEEPVEETKE